VFPFPQSGEQFVNLLPTAGGQVRIEGAAHFLQEDRRPQIVEAMLNAFGRPIT
jgi:haloalkane dehalogenase